MIMTQLLTLLIFNLLYLNAHEYSCKNKTCVVNCASNPSFCSNSIINGNNAISLNVICNEDSICNLAINCPQNVNGSSCELTCNGNYGCNNINFVTFSSNASIQCENNPNIPTANTTQSICSNITISSSPNDFIENKSTQNITIDCLLSFTKSTCQNISQNVSIICGSIDFVDKLSINVSSNIAGNNFTIKNNNNAANFYVSSYYGIKNVYVMNTKANVFHIENHNETSNVYYHNNNIFIRTESLFSGKIYVNNECNNFSLQCNNKIEIDNTCTNLHHNTTQLNPSYFDSLNSIAVDGSIHKINMLDIFIKLIHSWKQDSGEAGTLESSGGLWGAGERGGIRTTEYAKFYAFSAKIDTEFDNADADQLVIAFSVKHEQKMDCGGGYAKLLPPGIDATNFNDDTDYTIMFGPDICGYSTKTVQDIFNYNGENLVRNNDVKAHDDEYTHTYLIVVNKDSTYEIRVGGKEEAKDNTNNISVSYMVFGGKSDYCCVYIRSGGAIFAFSGHTDVITNVKWGGEGYIYWCSRDRSIRVWSTSNYTLNNHLIFG